MVIFSALRSNLRKARFLTANLYRKHLHKERAEAAGWVLEPDSVDDQSPGDANLIEKCESTLESDRGLAGYFDLVFGARRVDAIHGRDRLTY